MSEPDISWDELNDFIAHEFGDSTGKGIDLMHEETEKEINRTRNRLAKEYKQAEKELKKKADDYLRQFEKADKEKANLVKQGLISKTEYIDWRKNKILYHKTMQNKVNSMAEYLSNVDRQAADIVRKNSFGVYAGNYNYSQYQIGKQIGTGASFTLLNEKSVERLAHKNPKLLPNPSDKVKKKIKSGELKKWNARKINNVITQGVLQGTPIPEIANALDNVTRMGWNNAVRNARTAMTGAQNAGRLDGYKDLEKQGVVQEKIWIATPDERTRESHLEIDGEQVKIDEPFSNGLMFPADPDGEPAEVYNCRCTMRTEVIGFRNADGSVTEIGHKRDETMHSGQMQAEIEQRKKQPGSITGEKFNKNNVEWSHHGELLKDALEKSDVQYSPVKQLKTKLNENEIIEKIGGGDKTKGSCVSLCYAYAGNKNGLDAIDFRGGKSREIMSWSLHNTPKLNGVVSTIENGGGVRSAKKLIALMEKDKEYILGTGRHAAIVRKNKNGKTEYLELQTNNNNGWHELTSTALKDRFACSSSYKSSQSEIIDIDSLKNSDEFRVLLGYINTAKDMQKKGRGGFAK